ncbi:hypothetical protein PCIT_a3871 [Pseudoalteromonas citrea]|uniref:Uncharacterized protein n=1 Tax=Pseudoalteromonas citrea TaxID=43655 RepID=A0AAD4AGF5_9GAMM|nr:hypothetical protein [Pseudoalteromonas citrea]KAF7767780.1 hypothetical protein PCIT_a3871 [Pseudoalteromonas citrea]
MKLTLKKKQLKKLNQDTLINKQLTKVVGGGTDSIISPPPTRQNDIVM